MAIMDVLRESRQAAPTVKRAEPLLYVSHFFLYLGQGDADFFLKPLFLLQ